MCARKWISFLKVKNVCQKTRTSRKMQVLVLRDAVHYCTNGISGSKHSIVGTSRFFGIFRMIVTLEFDLKKSVKYWQFTRIGTQYTLKTKDKSSVVENFFALCEEYRQLENPISKDRSKKCLLMVSLFSD